MKKLSLEEVKKVGDLARLEISDAELEPMANHFNRILEYFSALEKYDLKDVSPFKLDKADSLRMREDEVVVDQHREAILDQSPSREGDFIKVPRIGGDA